MIDISEIADEDLWCGVFQGGGARGAAYAGALEALHAHGQWFRAVAGSSAGAITAILVAACLDPIEIRRQTPLLLASIQPATPLDRAAHTLGWRHLTRYDSQALETALDDLLRVTVRGRSDDPEPISFAELYAASGIHAYVLVADASTGVPIPFCVETTPRLSVAAAVVASCSIPVVFAPRYATVHTDDSAPDEPPVVRQLQDGGLWANFPAFVFTDQAFRSYYDLDPRAVGRVLGLALMYDRCQPTHVDRLLDVPARQQRRIETYTTQPTTGADRPIDAPARAVDLARRCLLPVICLLSAVVLLLTRGSADLLLLPAATLIIIGLLKLGSVSWRLVNLVLANLPVALGGLYLASALSLLADPAAPGRRISALITAALGLALIMVGVLVHRVADRTATGLQAILTIVTGQTIKPAPWATREPGSHVIYLRTGQLDMLSFDAQTAVLDEAIDAARASCHDQLDQILSRQNASRSGSPAPRR